MTQAKEAIVLVNLGTPDAPEAEAIRRYLKQFLSDPRVVDLPRWLWLPILNLIILKTRPKNLVEKYELIWGTHDGPIRNITRALAARLQQRLPTTKVVSAMTYGAPSMAATPATKSSRCGDSWQATHSLASTAPRPAASRA